MIFKTKILFAFTLIVCTEFSSAVDVKTSSGVVRGSTKHALNKDINVFIGIPFAEPPVGKLRFAKPEPIKKPKPGIIDATKRKNSCMNNLAHIGEDCLFVNVWAPKANTTALKPVMFWIYGGALTGGSIFEGPEQSYNGIALAADDVVVVTTNYRLRAFGFLYGGEGSDAPGNQGLYDQLLALKWVNENIHLFGGDKDKITIWGQSSGSSSVSAHIVSPLAKGLFKRAIMESGAFYPTAKDQGNKARFLSDAQKMAKHFNCNDFKGNAMIECLRKVDAKQLNAYQLPMGFVEDSEFLPLKTRDAFKQNKFNDVDLIAGTTKNDFKSAHCTTHLFAKGLAEHTKNVYFYDFTYGAAEHSAEKTWVWGMKVLDPPKDKAEAEFGRQCYKFWTNFAKTGVPAPANVWPRFDGGANAKVKELNAQHLNSILDNPMNKICGNYDGND